MSYSDNNSYFGYNQTDYIDLDTALAEEELASIGYGSSNGNENIDNTFKLSFKSYDDNTVERLRRSLVTPLSASQIEDPMYEALERNMYKWNQPKTMSYSPRVETRITMSPTNSVADSLAGYHKIISDSNEVDLVKSDLKDFMGSYNINDLMSRSDTMYYSTPSPQNSHRYNQDALVTRNDNNRGTASLHASNINRNSPDSSSLTQSNKHNEGRAPYRGSLLLELASKPAASEQNSNTASNLNIIHHTSSSKENLNSIDQLTHDAPSLNRVVHNPTVTDNTASKRESKQSSRNVTITSRYSQRRVSNEKTESSNDATKNQTRDMPTTSRYTQRRLSNSHAESNNDATKKQGRYVPAVTSRYAQRRLSNDNTESNKDTSKNQGRDLTAVTSRYAQRRLSNDNTESNKDISKNQSRNITVVTSRYDQRRLSNSHVESNNDTPKNQGQDIAGATSRYDQRRLSNSHAESNNDTPKNQGRDIAGATSRYDQRRLSNSHAESNNDTSKNQGRDIAGATSRYDQRHLSNSHAESNNDTPKNQGREVAGVTSRYVQRRLSNSHAESNNNAAKKQGDNVPVIKSRHSQNRLFNDNTESNNGTSKNQGHDVAVVTSGYAQRRLSSDNTESKKIINPEIRMVSSRCMKTISPSDTVTASRLEPVKTDQQHTRKTPSNRILLLIDEHSLELSDESNARGTSLRADVSNDTPQSSISRRSSFRSSVGVTSTGVSVNHSPSSTDKRASYHSGYAKPNTSSVSQQHRRRSFSVPSSECLDAELPVKHSLLPVLSTRIRKYSNPLLSKQATVPENEVAPRYTPKEVRFSVNSNNEVHPLPSYSTDGCSNSTVSSQSEDFDSGPSTPPRYSYLDHSRQDKRKSVPAFSNKDATYESRLRRNSNSYLNKSKDVHEIQDIANNSGRHSSISQTQQKKHLTESVREVLVQVQQRRARTAAIIKGLYQ